jgi:2-keto-3-deoxy-L-rhamnonate aldolase RhmA
MNPFKNMMNAAGGRPPIGTWVMSASPIVAEAVGTAGFEWAVLDMEHSPVDTMDLVHLLQAVGNTRMLPIVRVPWNDAVTVKRVLDAGAKTLLFPFIQNADEAARAVAATRYPPQGTRGLAGMSRASRFGTAPDHFRNANQQVSAILQIETAQAAERVDEILAVEGVDGLFLGPADLSASMGLVGQLMHPDVMGVMGRVAQRCRQLGKPVGTVGGTPEAVVQYRAAGFDFVAVGSDLGLLMRASQQALAALKPSSAEQVHTLATGTAPQGY